MVAVSLKKKVSRLVVLEFGRKIGDGVPQTVMALPAVRRSYLGIGEDAA